MRYVLLIAVGLALVGSPASASPRVPTLNMELEIGLGSTPKLQRAFRFIWTHWQARRPAQVNLTFFGKDAGVIYTVTVRRNRAGRWQVDEYRRAYHAPEDRPQPLEWVQTGYRWFRYSELAHFDGLNWPT